MTTPSMGFQPISGTPAPGGGGFQPISANPIPTQPYNPYQPPVPLNNQGPGMGESLKDPIQQVGNFFTAGQGMDPLGLLGKRTSSLQGIYDPAGFFGGGAPKVKGKIDPTTGTVNIKGRGSKWDNAYTNYLRTGQGRPDVKKDKQIMRQIEALRASGWQYQDPNAPPAAPPPVGFQPIMPGTGG